MNTIHVLSIGNSFSRDAHRYLHDLARKAGVKIETVNLVIGGCPLDKHFRNVIGEACSYEIEINGQIGTGFCFSIKEALLARNWDYVTIQQASHLSYKEETYQPYLTEVVSYIRSMCPKAKVLLQQTWGYETGSQRCMDHGFCTYEEMFAEVRRCYDKAGEEAGVDGIIPSGTAFLYALQNGIPKIHRDTFHASYGLGRLILAMVWYGYLTGNEMDPIDFDDLDEAVSPHEYEIAREAAKFALKESACNR